MESGRKCRIQTICSLFAKMSVGRIFFEYQIRKPAYKNGHLIEITDKKSFLRKISVVLEVVEAFSDRNYG